jgi:predicted kinase
MTGIPGSGKTFFAEHFSDTFKAPCVSFNRLRNELFNDPTYSNDELAIIGRVANYMLGELFKTGLTVVYDGLADTKSSRQAIARKAESNGYQPLIVWVQTESTAARARTTKTVPGKVKMSKDRFDANQKRFSAPSAEEKAVVISGKHTYASQLKIILSRLVVTTVKTDDNHAPVRGSEERHITIR